MPDRPLLPLLDGTPSERSDAAHNRSALLDAARCLVEREGATAVTVDAIAERAGVGKGTVFRRFGSRAGLMGALVNQIETDWQEQVIRGEPPLGPGAPPLERLLAVGHSRIDQHLRLAELLESAGGSGGRNYASYSFVAMHVRYLLTELGVSGDLPLLATALLAPLEVPILLQQIQDEGMTVERIRAGWEDLVRRVVGDLTRPAQAP